MGVVSPIGEQGSGDRQGGGAEGGWDYRCSGVQLNRFCASAWRREHGGAEVRSGWEDLVVAGGVRA
jgi:acetyl-CoA C-acetyltransferase